MECGNPLFLEWIGEWMEYARENNNQAYFLYRKAYESMAKYPTKFTHPFEAMCLAGIGEKMVIRLEKKLIEHCKDNNLPMPTNPNKPKARAKSGKHAVEVEEDGQPAQKKTRVARAEKTYVPAYRSGSYAILLTLLDAKTQTPNSDGAMSKHEITSKGQVYCDASLTNADHGKFYTAWSSMKTLMNKNLVYQSSTMYYLTEEGTNIAQRMKAVAGETDPGPNTAASLDDMAEEGPSTSSTAPQKKTVTKGKGRQRHPAAADVMDHVEQHAPEATLRPDSATRSSTHISQTQPTYNSYDYSFHREETHGNRDTVSSDFGLRTSGSLTAPSGASRSTISSSSSLQFTRDFQEGHKDQPVDLLSDSENEKDATLSAKSSRSTPPGLKRTPSEFKLPIRPTPMDSVAKGTMPPALSASTSTASSTSFSSVISRPNSFKGAVLSRSSSSKAQKADATPAKKHDSFPHLTSNSFSLTRTTSGSVPSNIEKLAEFQPVMFHPGTFEILLVLDIREVRTQSDRDYIGEKLMERGISVVKRALDIGDVIWVARLKEPSSNGLSEIVLDYVVERKRMDDLVSSIKDGRFNEQKFRLRRSGLGNIIYLVETYKVGEMYEIGVDALRTAMTSTQVHDGFFLRRTNHTDQTIDYFVSITNALRRLYESKILYAIPDENIDRATYLDLQNHLKDTCVDRTYLISYRSFGLLNGKSETLVIRDAFVKMLMTIRGISSEKATEIARVFGTPRALFSALEHAKNDKARANVVGLAGSNVGRKKIGPALGRKVMDLWYSDEYE